jgi:hypothetical protein
MTASLPILRMIFRLRWMLALERLSPFERSS